MLREELPAGGSWMSGNWRRITLAAAALLLISGVAAGLVLRLGGGAKTLYEWSASERLEGGIRLERRLGLSRNAGGSPYRFTVRLQVVNAGSEELAEVNLEEALPDMLADKGEPAFTLEPTKRSRDGTVFGWTKRPLAKGGTIELAYHVDLAHELSGPQLREIERHFAEQKIKYIGVPGMMVDCQACAGSGRTACATCSGAASITCPKCGGAKALSCPECGGSGSVRCPVCGGYGYYCSCYQCGAPRPIGTDYCPNCGTYRHFT